MEFDPFDEAPVLAHPGLPVFSVFRHADVQAILRDPATWSSVSPPLPGTPTTELMPFMLVMDPPVHTRLRALVNQAFTSRVVEQLEPRLVAIADSLVARAVEERRVDLMDALAHPLPVVVIAELLGVPIEDRPQFRRWSTDVTATLGGVVGTPDEERLAATRRALRELRAYFDGLVADRRAHPRDDLLSALVAAEVALATRETEIALLTLLTRARSFARTDDTPLPLHPSIAFRSFTSVPLELVAN